MEPRFRRSLLVLLMIALAALLTACGSPETTTEPTGTEPAATQPAPTAEEPADGAAEDPGQALVDTKCSMCHTLERVQNASYDEAGWTAVVERMETAGLVITAEEKAQIIATLSGTE